MCFFFASAVAKGRIIGPTTSKERSPGSPRWLKPADIPDMMARLPHLPDEIWHKIARHALIAEQRTVAAHARLSRVCTTWACGLFGAHGLTCAAQRASRIPVLLPVARLVIRLNGECCTPQAQQLYLRLLTEDLVWSPGMPLAVRLNLKTVPVQFGGQLPFDRPMHSLDFGSSLLQYFGFDWVRSTSPAFCGTTCFSQPVRYFSRLVEMHGCARSATRPARSTS